MLLDALLKYLSDEINGRAPSLTSLEWGQEIRRLPAASQVIWNVYEHGKPEPLPLPEAPQPPPENFVSERSIKGLDVY